MDIEKLLDKVNGIFDFAYENAVEREEKEYINAVEDELRDCIKSLCITKKEGE